MGMGFIREEPETLQLIVSCRTKLYSFEIRKFIKIYKARFIRRILVTSNAIQTIDNEG